MQSVIPDLMKERSDVESVGNPCLGLSTPNKPQDVCAP